MKTSLRSTLRQSKALQAKYNRLGSPSTQNVRNPFPMHKLAKDVLPLLPDPNETVPVTIQTRFTFNGRVYIEQSKGFKYVRDVVPPSEWQQNGKTVEDVVNDLVNLGYIINKPSTVAMALTSAVRRGKITAVPQTRRIGQMGRARSLYFATK